MLENQIRGLAVVFGVRLPHARSRGFVEGALQASEGINGLAEAMRGLVDARIGVMSAVAAIDADLKRMARNSEACGRLMAIPGVGPITALAFAAAIDDPARFRRSRDVGAYLGLVPRRYQSGEIDYVGSISKCGDQAAYTPLRGRQRPAHAFPGRLEAEGLGLGHQRPIRHAQGSRRARAASRRDHARDAPQRHLILANRLIRPDRIGEEEGERPELPSGAHARGREQRTAPIL
jgi:hypothetical protein